MLTAVRQRWVSDSGKSETASPLSVSFGPQEGTRDSVHPNRSVRSFCILVWARWHRPGGRPARRRALLGGLSRSGRARLRLQRAGAGTSHRGKGGGSAAGPVQQRHGPAQHPGVGVIVGSGHSAEHLRTTGFSPGKASSSSTLSPSRAPSCTRRPRRRTRRACWTACTGSSWSEIRAKLVTMRSGSWSSTTPSSTPPTKTRRRLRHPRWDGPARSCCSSTECAMPRST